MSQRSVATTSKNAINAAANAAAQKKNAAPSKKVIFNAGNVAAHLTALKEAAGEEGGAWWTPAISIEWGSTRQGNNGTQWTNIVYTDEHGVSGRLIIRINGEYHTGQIMPNSDAGVTALAMQAKNSNMKVEKRTKKPSIQIKKWAAQVKVAADGISILTDDNGQPILPGDETLSAYYQVADCVGEAFAFEAKKRVDRGLEFVAFATKAKQANKTALAQTVYDEFVAAAGSGGMILATESAGTIRRLFPAPKDSELLLKAATIASIVKITNLVQKFISDRANKNAGCPLPNPITRIAMNFDGETGLAQLALFDKDMPYTADGKQKYEVGKVDGKPVDADNIHKFVLSRSSLDGIVSMDSVCFSSMGISMPVKAEVLVVGKPTSREVSLDDVYDDVVSAPSEATAADATATATATAGATDTAAEENYDNLLDELSGGDTPVAPAK